ncbi:MAG: hypothetical protein AAF321_00585 [Pseudomonadota bacterium]
MTQRYPSAALAAHYRPAVRRARGAKERRAKNDYWTSAQKIARAANKAHSSFERWRRLRRSLVGLACLPLALGGPELASAAMDRTLTAPVAIRYVACSAILLGLAILCLVSEKTRQATFMKLNYGLEVRLSEMEAAYVFAVVSLDRDPADRTMPDRDGVSGGDAGLVRVEEALPAERVADDLV